MANDLTLNGANQTQSQVINYYNQIQKQLGGSAPTISARMVTAPQQIQYQAVDAPQALQAIQNPGTYTPYTLQSPGQLQAQRISAPTGLNAPTYAAPERVMAERIQVADQSYEDIAKQIAAYLRPYTDNAIRARQKQTGTDRAAADVDAASRGMVSSTWLSDAKNRMAAAEASDIANMENEYLGNLGQQAFNTYQNQLNRRLQADMQNSANQLQADLAYANLLQNYNKNIADYQWDAARLNAQYAYDAALQNANAQMAADQFNIAQQAALDQYNANAINAANQANWEREYDIALRNSDIDRYNSEAAYNAAIAERAYRDALAQMGREWQFDADQFNARMDYDTQVQNADLWATLQQLAWARAGQLGELTDPVAGGGGGAGSNAQPVSPITYQLSVADKKAAKDKALASLGYTKASDNTTAVRKGGSKNNNFLKFNP